MPQKILTLNREELGISKEWYYQVEGSASGVCDV